MDDYPNGTNVLSTKKKKDSSIALKALCAVLLVVVAYAAGARSGATTSSTSVASDSVIMPKPGEDYYKVSMPDDVVVYDKTVCYRYIQAELFGACGAWVANCYYDLMKNPGKTNECDLAWMTGKNCRYAMDYAEKACVKP